MGAFLNNRRQLVVVAVVDLPDHARQDRPRRFSMNLSSVLELPLVYGLPVIYQWRQINVHVEDPTDTIAPNYLDLLNSMDMAHNT